MRLKLPLFSRRNSAIFVYSPDERRLLTRIAENQWAIGTGAMLGVAA